VLKHHGPVDERAPVLQSRSPAKTRRQAARNPRRLIALGSLKRPATRRCSYVLKHHGPVDERAPILQKPFPAEDLAAKLREILDA